MYTYVQTKNWGAIYIQLKANIFSRSSLCLQIRYTTQWSQRRNCWCKSEGRSARFGFHWLNNQHYTVALVSLSLVMVMMTMMVMTDRSRQWWKSNYNDCYHHQPSLGHTASTTGWSRATVFYDFYLTGIKKHQIGKTQPFLWRFYMDILIFWYPKRVRWKNSRLSGLCQNGVFSSLTRYSINYALKWTPKDIWSPKQIDLSLNTLPPWYP